MSYFTEKNLWGSEWMMIEGHLQGSHSVWGTYLMRVTEDLKTENLLFCHNYWLSSLKWAWVLVRGCFYPKIQVNNSGHCLFSLLVSWLCLFLPEPTCSHRKVCTDPSETRPEGRPIEGLTHARTWALCDVSLNLMAYLCSSADVVLINEAFVLYQVAM